MKGESDVVRLLNRYPEKSGTHGGISREAGSVHPLSQNGHGGDLFEICATGKA